ncbi:MAG: two component transcriptional regulator, LuxR family protein [Paenibacillus sp.]|nr:two component transcriptional regulator, LuxR family protein [Paenibacillus sp.]
MLNILIVDDHPSVMEGTKAMLEKDSSLHAVLSHNPLDVVEMIKNQTFDVLLFDLHMPGMNGIELTKAVLSEDPDAVILIYTGVDISPHFNKLMEAGVSGFLSKTATQEQLITAIRCAGRREAVIPFQLLKELRKDSYKLSDAEEADDIAFSTKDRVLLKELAKGKSNREMAEKLIMSQRSLEYGLTRLFQKLKVRSRIEAVSKAKQVGILMDEDFI